VRRNARRSSLIPSHGKKVFWFFFSKKNYFLSYAAQGS
jgi:hypothetical protein